MCLEICKEVEFTVLPDVLTVSEQILETEQVRINNTLTVTIMCEPEHNVYCVTMPWGEEPWQATSLSQAQNIRCSVLRGDCQINRISDPKIGDYWLLTRRSFQEPYLQIKLEGIHVSEEGLTCLRVLGNSPNIAKGIWYQAPIFKKKIPLQIDQFTANKRTVEKGTIIKLSWRILGAQSCVLNPGNLPVRAVGSKEFAVTEDSLFTLRAYRGRQAVSKNLIVYVK